MSMVNTQVTQVMRQKCDATGSNQCAAPGAYEVRYQGSAAFCTLVAPPKPLYVSVIMSTGSSDPALTAKWLELNP
jgi:hypothetical protein